MVPLKADNSVNAELRRWIIYIIGVVALAATTGASVRFNSKDIAETKSLVAEQCREAAKERAANRDRIIEVEKAVIIVGSMAEDVNIIKKKILGGYEGGHRE